MIRHSRMMLTLFALAACAKTDKPAEKPAAVAATTPPVRPEQKPQAPGPVVHPTSPAEWEAADYTASSIAVADLKPLPLDEVQHIRAIIFGKHGRIFEDSTLQTWLVSRPWYHADKAFSNARLSSNEKANLDVVREAEAEKHPQIESGDMRFYQDRVLTSTMLGKHTPQDWQVLEAEVLANHGYVFATEEIDFAEDNSLELQKYFNERYWYERKPDFQPNKLSAIERQNLDTIAVAMTRQNGRRLSVGMMNLFQSTPLSDSLLQNLPIAELRLLRNEVYARHGRIFKTAWLAQRFHDYPWYKPRADYSDAELSPVERANIALIVTREQQMHDELSTKLLAPGDVQGLPNDDARLLRNEIYARHGRRFQDPGLRAYFSSFAWYKPNDSFNEDQLNDVEKKNATLIRQYEQGKFSEG
jgi:hypothetical protein